ncbi:MAG TPA: IS481 family transposase [Candidatus Angelobacter sp.]|nr:IS481 family transposase [Candidatus Angelobacter sp.]
MKEVAEQRVRFVVAASRGEKSLTGLCREFEISRPTGYLWLKRYEEQGIAGLQDHNRRPQHSPRRTSEVMEGRVVELRKQWPDWGARKLSRVLGKEGMQLPASTVHRIVQRHNLVREQDRQSQAVKRFEREEPNQLWQMDFKGPKGWDEPVGPLAVLDDHSRYVTVLERTGSTQAEAVQTALEKAFHESGVPQAMLMDHGTPWCNGQGYRGWTRLTVWLMNQDIELHWSGLRHPQTQGKVERFNGSMTAALLRRGRPAQQERQSWLDQFRYEYNHVRPHEALGMRTPAELWRSSERKFQSWPVAWVYPAGTEVTEVDRSGSIRLQGRRWYLTQTLVDQQVGVTEVGPRWLVHYRRTLIAELDPRQSGSVLVDPS